MKKENELVVTGFLSDTMTLGQIFAQSGMFKDIKTQSEAVVKILAGRELGLAPIESMNNIYIVNGKTTVMSNVISSLIKRSKKYDYKIDVLTEIECTMTFYSIEDKKLTEIGKSSFTFKDAAKAGLANKDVWKNYPKNMLFARALTNGARWYCPDVFSGYAPEEIENIAPEQDEAVVLEFDETGNKVNETVVIGDEGVK